MLWGGLQLWVKGGYDTKATGETMTRAVANIGRYRSVPGTGGFDGWLFGICRHVVLDAQRAAGRRGYGPPPETVSHEDPVERLVSADEAAATTQTAAAWATGGRPRTPIMWQTSPLSAKKPVQMFLLRPAKRFRVRSPSTKEKSSGLEI